MICGRRWPGRCDTQVGTTAEHLCVEVDDHDDPHACVCLTLSPGVGPAHPGAGTQTVAGAPEEDT